MGFITLLMRELCLQQRCSTLNSQLLSLTKELQNLAAFSSELTTGQGFINPFSTVGLGVGAEALIAQNNCQGSIWIRRQWGMNMAMYNSPEIQKNPQYMMQFRQGMLQKAREQWVAVQEKRIARKEREISNKKTRIEAELAMISKEHDSVKQAREKEADKAGTFKFV